MPPLSIQDLELVPTSVLLDALLVRYDDVIFAARLARPEADHPQIKIHSRRHRGDIQACIGLAFGVMTMCQAVHDEDEEEISADDL
jgi:hypothetical protein